MVCGAKKPLKSKRPLMWNVATFVFQRLDKAPMWVVVFGFLVIFGIHSIISQLGQRGLLEVCYDGDHKWYFEHFHLHAFKDKGRFVCQAHNKIPRAL